MSLATESNELRFNRYFYDYNGKKLAIDAFLGALWGLNLAKVYFADRNELQNSSLPPIAIAEVTNNEFFNGNPTG